MTEIVTPAELFTSCEWEPMAWHWMEPDMGYRCTEPGCGFDVPCDRYGSDSYQFRAEEHARGAERERSWRPTPVTGS